MTQSTDTKSGFHLRHNRRNERRSAISQPCIMFPVLPGGFPDPNFSVGFTLDISQVGIGFEVAGDNHLSTGNIMFGMEDGAGEMNFVSANLRFLESQEAGQRIGAEYASPDQQLFRSRNILPFFNTRTFQFETGLCQEALQAWEDCGVLARAMHDRIKVCPRCQAVPTWRDGCPVCGSASTRPDRLVHHYACAHVGRASDFEREGEIVCPKCRVRNLVVGADFEFLNGPYRCDHCGWTDSKLSPIANCLSCGLRFPGHQAEEKSVNGYDVKRLDPLVYLS